MSRQGEAIFGEKFDKALKERFGKDCTNENIQQASIVATADRHICVRGRSIRVELKDTKGLLAPLQLVKLMEHKRAGGLSFVVVPYNMEAVIDDIDIKTRGNK